MADQGRHGWAGMVRIGLVRLGGSRQIRAGRAKKNNNHGGRMYITLALLFFTVCTCAILILFNEGRRMAIDPSEYHEWQPPKPLRNGRDGVPASARAHEIARFAAWHREQMAAEMEELCRFCGTTPDEDCLPRDLCIEVIYDGTLTLDECLKAVAKYQRKQKGKAS